MGHGKETPRQKMIGMMYLVLTALLALNVSAEVLNAFLLVDQSLRKSRDNIQSKTEVLYTQFETAYSENPDKVEEWKNEADSVKILTRELVDFMEFLKDTIVITADKQRTYIDSGRDVHLVQTKDDNNIPGQIMVLEMGGVPSNGKVLQDKIEGYRAHLIGIIERKGPHGPDGELDTARVGSIISGIEKSLSTDGIEGHGGEVDWVNGNFNHLPLVAVLTMLSKFQADVRNAEADIINWLSGQIDAGSWKFNKLEAIVNANANYILQGNEYKAEVFIAASDSTQDPEIVLAGGTKLDIKNGKGIYNGNTSTVGFTKWGGVIKMESPSTGEILEFPFSGEYQVGQSSLVVSPTKMNVFYIGVDNPVEISVSGVPQDKVQASISAGSMSPAAGGYNVKVTRAGEVFINVSAEVDGNVKSMGSKKFRCKFIPDPVAKVANSQGGVIGKNELMAQAGVFAVLDNFDFDAKFSVTSYKVSTTDAQGYTVEKIVTGAGFTSDVRGLIQGLAPGKKVYFEEIKAVGPDGTPRSLGAIGFRVQ